MAVAERVAKGLREVEDVFRAQLASNRQPGACLAVYHRGQLVLDLVGGLADTQQGRRVVSNTPFVLFSSTKPLASVCIHILLERGALALDTPLAEVWPEFAKNGRETVTVRHLLTHRAGIPDTPPELTPQKWSDWDVVVAAMENATPRYAPGTT
jgi:CubicO group peptidase (beta-lactamase class C family)